MKVWLRKYGIVEAFELENRSGSRGDYGLFYCRKCISKTVYKKILKKWLTFILASDKIVELSKTTASDKNLLIPK